MTPERLNRYTVNYVWSPMEEFLRGKRHASRSADDTRVVIKNK